MKPTDTPIVDTEVERVNNLIRSGIEYEDMAEAYAWKLARELERELAEARARTDILERAHDSLIEEQASLCAEGQSITELVAAKDKLIEQMQKLVRYYIKHQDKCSDEENEYTYCLKCHQEILKERESTPDPIDYGLWASLDHWRNL